MFDQNKFEDMLFEYIEQFRLIISPEIWGNVLLDYSKNEILVLLLLYRKGENNMSQIADYLNVPLNTATGIIARMENKKMILRNRHLEDKRVVTIAPTDIGKQQMNEIIRNVNYYINQIMNDLTHDELNLIMSIFDKVINILQQTKLPNNQEVTKKSRKIIIE